jgi:propionyl-CoA carboxylase alpha chain
MFKRILIANRGEIACRIIKTARRMGIETVAVYSQADREAVHVEMADLAVPIGPPAPGESYLCIERIIEACEKTAAEAVHPGYGFLSEREAFPRALALAGIVFIGPNSAAIAVMGDKIESKKAAVEAKVFTIPGHLGAVEDEAHAARIADELGYPVMIKASAGGGGKGMRIAHSRRELAEGLSRARSEAGSAFGDDRVFIEKFIADPRHIEIQVLGDKHGNIIHLGERECSIQRRNQKVVEEAPSPLLDDATRSRMGRQAVALAKAVGYDSAGTVEFIAGQDKSFYFLEMNTRLQVEHPVTELVTGIDLVEQMIRVAAGEKLTLGQSEVTLSGWAVETRIYAEDPTRNFLPSVGRLQRYRPPDGTSLDATTIRIDSGVAEGGEISLYYDPLIAKLITHAPTRERAVAAQGQALDAFTIEGVRHNISFLSALMRHRRWQKGRLSTAFIQEEFPQGFRPLPPQDEAASVLAAVAAAIDHVLGERKRAISGQMPASAFRRERRRVVRLGEREIVLDIMRAEANSAPGTRARSPHGAKRNAGPADHAPHPGYQAPDYASSHPGTQGAEAEPGGEAFAVRFAEPAAGDHRVLRSGWKPGDTAWKGTFDGEEIAVQVRPVLNGFDLSHGGVEVRAFVYTEREAAAARLMPAKKLVDSGKAVRCPMPGLVLSISVVEGQDVKAGETLAVVEAMKMENVLRAERDGIVKKVYVRQGDSLAVDAVLLEFV